MPEDMQPGAPDAKPLQQRLEPSLCQFACVDWRSQPSSKKKLLGVGSPGSDVVLQVMCQSVRKRKGSHTHRAFYRLQLPMPEGTLHQNQATLEVDVCKS